MADLIADGDHWGWNDLTYAATPAAWGQAIEVPDNMLNFTRLVSEFVGGATGEYAAKIPTPGAVISGCIWILTVDIFINHQKARNSVKQITFMISLTITFGPLEEKEATMGYREFREVLDVRIRA